MSKQRQKPKTIGEYTDRELMERIAINSKVTADNLSFIKNAIVLSAIVSLILFVVAMIF